MQIAVIGLIMGMAFFQIFKITRFSFLKSELIKPMMILEIDNSIEHTMLTKYNWLDQHYNKSVELGFSNFVNFIENLVVEEQIQCIEVRSNSNIQINFSKWAHLNKLKVTCMDLNSRNYVQQTSLSGITIPKKDGLYAYEINSIWKQGDLSFLFVLEVKNK